MSKINAQKIELFRVDMGDNMAITNYIRMDCSDRLLCLSMNLLIDKHMVSSIIIANAWIKRIQIGGGK